MSHHRADILLTRARAPLDCWPWARHIPQPDPNRAGLIADTRLGCLARVSLECVAGVEPVHVVGSGIRVLWRHSEHRISVARLKRDTTAAGCDEGLTFVRHFGHLGSEASADGTLHGQMAARQSQIQLRRSGSA